MLKRKKIHKTIDIGIITFVAFIHILPLLIVVLNSLRTRNEISRKMIGLPITLNWDNFSSAWALGSYANAYALTIFIAIVSAGVVMFVTGLASYGIEKINCYFKNFLSGYFIVGLSIPYFAMMVPVFFVFYNLKLTNSPSGLIIIYIATNIPFCFMFVSAFFKGLPRELDEAARIDGCSEIQNFWYNTLPLAKPILTSVILITFVNCWNEFLFANLFLQTDKYKTIALSFFVFTGRFSNDYGRLFAAAVISILPIIVIYLLMQNTFVDGLTAGGVKG
jgi:raffinose/stachyose/melibiose transport system permease protein